MKKHTRILGVGVLALAFMAVALTVNMLPARAAATVNVHPECQPDGTYTIFYDVTLSGSENSQNFSVLGFVLGDDGTLLWNAYSTSIPGSGGGTYGGVFYLPAGLGGEGVTVNLRATTREGEYFGSAPLPGCSVATTTSTTLPPTTTTLPLPPPNCDCADRQVTVSNADKYLRPAKSLTDDGITCFAIRLVNGQYRVSASGPAAALNKLFG